MWFFQGKSFVALKGEKSACIESFFVLVLAFIIKATQWSKLPLSCVFQNNFELIMIVWLKYEANRFINTKIMAKLRFSGQIGRRVFARVFARSFAPLA